MIAQSFQKDGNERNFTENRKSRGRKRREGYWERCVCSGWWGERGEREKGRREGERESLTLASAMLMILSNHVSASLTFGSTSAHNERRV